MWSDRTSVWCVVLSVAAAAMPCWAGVPAEGRILQTSQADEQWEGQSQWPEQEQKPWSSLPGGDYDEPQPIPQHKKPQNADPSISSLLGEHRFRGPLAVLVNTAPESLRFTQKLWTTVSSMNTDFNMELILVPFNSTELHHTTRPLRMEYFLQALYSLVPSVEDRSGGLGFLSIRKAVLGMHYDSAVLLFTGQAATDEDLAQSATTELIQKRCKLFVWWNGQQHDGAENIYREVAEQTGGMFTPVIDEQSTELEQRWPVEIPMVTLAVRRGATGHLNIPVHMDSTVSSVRITVAGEVAAVVLYNTAGTPLNLQSEESLRLYQPGAVALSRGPGVVDVQLNTTGAPSGVWKLTTTGLKRRYDVTVKASSNLGVSAVDFKDTDDDAHPNLKINLHGAIGKIQTVSALCENGTEVRRLQFEQTNPVQLKDGTMGSELVIESTDVPQTPFYLQFDGEDTQGTQFTRLSYVDYQHMNLGRALIVRVRLDNQLVVLPGQSHILRFDITNNVSRPLVVHLSCRSMQGVYIKMQPIIQLQPRQTAPIAIYLQIPQNAPLGTMDTITFIADAGIDSVTKTLNLYMDQMVRDRDNPTVDTVFHNDCKNADESRTCNNKVWNMQATIQDQSGILDITSEPKELQYTVPFTIGNKSPVRVLYSASCCNPKLEIKVTDLYNNTITTYIDVYKQNESSSLSSGEIAAIVVGIILIVILIIAIVLTIIYCRNKQKVTFQQQHQTPR